MSKTASSTCERCRGTGFEIRDATGGVTVAVPCECSFRERGNRRIREAGFPRRYDHCTLDSFEDHDPSHREALAVAREWVERWPVHAEHGLLFLGRPGTGKTHLAVGIGRELAERKGAHVRFHEQRELLKALQSTFDAGASVTSTDVLGPILDVEVLILDDVGAGRMTPWSREVLHDIIVHRYNEKLPLIMTSNHDTGVEEDVEGGQRAPAAEGLTLRDRLGDALMSRIHEMCLMVTVKGHDYRRNIRNARHQF